MGYYLHHFNDKASHDEVYHVENQNYLEPWTGNIERETRGTRYSVSYNITIYASENRLEFNGTGGAKTLTIECKNPWSAESDCNWVTVSPANGSRGSHTLTVTAQETEEDRNGKITITDEDGNKALISIIENAIVVPPSVIWLDSFEDLQYIVEGADYATFEDYMTDYIDDPYAFGSNRYVFTNETFELDGETYYLYEFDEYSFTGYDVQYGLLPMNYSKSFLYQKSMEADYDNRFRPFAYLLRNDEETYWINEEAGVSYVLAMIEE